jgi:hypothetical protein
MQIATPQAALNLRGLYPNIATRHRELMSLRRRAKRWPDDLRVE